LQFAGQREWDRCTIWRQWITANMRDHLMLQADRDNADQEKGSRPNSCPARCHHDWCYCSSHRMSTKLIRVITSLDIQEVQQLSSRHCIEREAHHCDPHVTIVNQGWRSLFVYDE
jgi:hypothetical protein